MSKSIGSFQPIDDDQSAHYLADHWPKGKLTGRRHDGRSIIYKFILSLAQFVKIFIGDLYTLVKNRDIDQALELLEEWEASVKIPEDIPLRDTIAGRREAVECLISKIPVYNIDDGNVDIRTTFEHYIECLTGIQVTISIDDSGGDYVFIIEVPVVGGSPNNQFRIPFPINFAGAEIPTATIQLINIAIDRVLPSFYRWEYQGIIA